MLPDILGPGLRVVFCGTAISTSCAERGHCYAGRGNRFWQLLHESGFTPTLLGPEDDATLPEYGVGITDLVKGSAQSHDAGLDFRGTGAAAGRLATAAPPWVAFNGLTAGREAGVRVGPVSRAQVALGEQAWNIGTSRVFVLPSSSGANATMPYPEKLQWWTRLYSLSR